MSACHIDKVNAYIIFIFIYNRVYCTKKAKLDAWLGTQKIYAALATLMRCA